MADIWTSPVAVRWRAEAVLALAVLKGHRQ